MILGAALLIGAAAMVVRFFIDRSHKRERHQHVSELIVRPIPTLIIGIIGGVMVGLTSVGSGSLMIVMLLFLYPLIGANQLVGTDLAQAVPLTLAAAIGALIFGKVEFGVTAVADHRRRCPRCSSARCSPRPLPTATSGR